MCQIKTMRQEMQDVLERNILRFWMERMPDHERGGFYGRIDGSGVLHPEAEKGAILNARILWTFSAAYRVLGNPAYLEMATRAKDYLVDHFIDPEYGGVYWSVDCQGRPLDTKKQFYAIGFALYGLSEYVRATDDREALDYALQLYDTIEEHAFDREHNGYIEACTRDWGKIEDMRLSDFDANYPKSQNTHLHIIEPYTNLYRCLKEFHCAISIPFPCTKTCTAVRTSSCVCSRTGTKFKALQIESMPLSKSLSAKRTAKASVRRHVEKLFLKTSKTRMPIT